MSDKSKHVGFDLKSCDGVAAFYKNGKIILNGWTENVYSCGTIEIPLRDFIHGLGITLEECQQVFRDEDT